MDVRSIRSAVVTGPTGAIGAALCRELLRAGAVVYAVARPGSARLSSLPPGVRAVSCALPDMAALPGLIPGPVDAFFHLAWAGTTGPARDDMSAQAANIAFALDAVRAAKALGCRVFVGAGSQAEYGRVDAPLRADTPCFPETGYGMAKLCAGQMTRAECAKLGLRHVWARVLSVYGPCDGDGSMLSRLIDTLLDGGRPPLTAGEQLWDYLYADDAAKALRLLAERGGDGQVYPLGSGEVRPLRAFAEAARDAVDPALPLGFGEVPYGPRQVMRLEADIGALARDTGFRPETSFETGIAETVRWRRARKTERSAT